MLRLPVLILALVAALLVAGSSAAGRLTPGPAIDLHSAGGLAPDGSSITVQVLASCPERWTVVEAVVALSQPQAAGRASFSFPCIGSIRNFTLVVPSSGGTFELGEAAGSASLTIQRGKTELVTDSQLVDVQPSVAVDLASTAQLESGGGAVSIGVTVACPVGAAGAESYVNVAQGQTTSGTATYAPVCDGQPHTFTLRVTASWGRYTLGAGQALTFATVVHDEIAFTGVDEGAVQIVD